MTRSNWQLRKFASNKGGGHAGHNGLRSIDAHLGDKNYWRVRLGVGHPGDKSQVSNHVLGDFSKQDRVWVERELAAVADELPLLLSGQTNDFMSRVAMGALKKQTAEPVSAAPKNKPTNPGKSRNSAEETAMGSALSRAMNRLRGRE